mmetsp:Transcript_57727/g.150404  ORF Transcript_57727/g.150404 Transcript_57727/m.150404 type:complete len:285 (+) Transcript_57727:656-1510(+)
MDNLLAGRQGLEREADRQQQLARALERVLGRNLVGQIARHELAAHGAYDFRGKQLAKVEVADELHVREHAVLAFLPDQLQVLSCVLRLLVFGGLEVCEQLLELVLANVKDGRLKRDRLTSVGGGELGEDGLEAEDQVRVGLAVVRLSQRFLEDELNNCLQLGSLCDLDGADLGHDGGDVLRAHLVQQSLDGALQVVNLAESFEELGRTPRRRVGGQHEVRACPAANRRGRPPGGQGAVAASLGRDLPRHRHAHRCLWLGWRLPLHGERLGDRSREGRRVGCDLA